MVRFFVVAMHEPRDVGGPEYENYSWKTIEATIMKIVPNDSKLVFVLNIHFTVVYCCLLFSYTKRFSTKKKRKSCHFFR